MVTSTSIVSGGRARDRYCDVAHTTGRPVVPSSAAMPAARPHPPNRNPPPVHTAGVIGSTHRCGLWVASRPRNCRASIEVTLRQRFTALGARGAGPVADFTPAHPKMTPSRGLTVVPPGDEGDMERQLHLLEVPEPDWHLDDT